MNLLDQLDFDLPPDRIAQYPAAQRDGSRLLVVDREAESLADRQFVDLTEYLQAGDVLVLNDTRVIPARLWAEKPATGARIEVILLEERESNAWEVLVRPGRRVTVGTELLFDPADLRIPARITAAGEGGLRHLEFQCECGVLELVERIGQMPLPPYIKREAPDPVDRERYQTVYACRPGAVAAPTAGLHFTPAVLGALRAQGVQTGYVTLHVGLGTFQPLHEAHVRSGRLHEERFVLPPETAEMLNAARSGGHRIVAVGTTVVRLLESVCCPDAGEPFGAQQGRTDLFLKPGDAFHAVDAMITNFHLPRSSLFALVSAFAGREQMLRAYAHAIEYEYRFYSYGDATLIV